MLLTFNNRDKFIASLPKNAICAEIGVANGENAARIMKHCSPKELYLIDPWRQYSTDPAVQSQKRRNLESQYKQVMRDFKSKRNVHVMRDFSINALSTFANNFFDWIYIDGSHEYSDVLDDLNMSLLKVRRGGGILCGHDYNDSGKNIGVKHAVDFFIKNHKLKLTALSMKGARDWAIHLSN